jgi:assimilatory nitrate reductase catalytic subunit
VKALNAALPEPRAEIHPDLARRHGIADGDLVELRSRRGAAVMRARLTDGIRPDTVFAPFHWPGVNALTNPALDPHSRMPAFKACAVAIAPLEKGRD